MGNDGLSPASASNDAHDEANDGGPACANKKHNRMGNDGPQLASEHHNEGATITTGPLMIPVTG